MTVRVFVPGDSSARSVGSDAVAVQIAAKAGQDGIDMTIVRNGTRGLFWLEPLVEVETDSGRVGYGPVRAADVEGLFSAGFLAGDPHPLRVGKPEEIPYLRGQERLTFARCGITDPVSIEDYESHGGFAGLRAAVAAGPEKTIDLVTASGLRGRGGAGFPAGSKWRTAFEQESDRKYVVCNADEGDSGNFADRMLLEGDPFSVIEGMAVAGLAAGASYGYIYLRSEYPDAAAAVAKALHTARRAGYLGADLAGSGMPFDIELRIGAGSYVCGEETALLESLEGKPGVVRAKPPYPAVSGLWGKPTIVNNVVTLATIPYILNGGAEHYSRIGFGRSQGTVTIQLSGDIKRPGLIETPFGRPLRDYIEGYGGGTASGRSVRAVQVGGPLGAFFPQQLFDVPVGYEEIAAAGGILGHASIVVFDESVDMAKRARFAMAFCALESCGKCTPCRIGSTRAVEVIDRVIAGQDREGNFALLDDLCELMRDGSLCQLGGLAPLPVQSAIRHFPEDFDRSPSPSSGPEGYGSTQRTATAWSGRGGGGTGTATGWSGLEPRASASGPAPDTEEEPR